MATTKTYVVEAPVRAKISFLIEAKSKAEAARKLNDYRIDGHPDITELDFIVLHTGKPNRITEDTPPTALEQL